MLEKNELFKRSTRNIPDMRNKLEDVWNSNYFFFKELYRSSMPKKRSTLDRYSWLINNILISSQ